MEFFFCLPAFIWDKKNEFFRSQIGDLRHIVDIYSVVLIEYFKSAFRMNGMDAKQLTSVHGRSN